MPPRDWQFRIRDILDSMAAIQEYVGGMDLEAFRADRKTVDGPRLTTVRGKRDLFAP